MHISPTFRHVAAPAQQWWGCPEQGPAPGEGTAAGSVLVLEPKVSQGSADHQVPLQGQDGQGPQPHDAWGDSRGCVSGTASAVCAGMWEMMVWFKEMLFEQEVGCFFLHQGQL